MGEWNPTSWQSATAEQLPEYPDGEALRSALARLAELPPLVTSWEVERLKEQLAEAARGRRFLLQGGACAESFERWAGDFSEVPASLHREELSIAFSEDDGVTWGVPTVIARQADAWLSYPYLFESRPGHLWVFARQAQPVLALSLDELDFVPG